MWSATLAKRLPKPVLGLVDAVIDVELDRLASRRDLSSRVERIGRRQADVFGAEVLGITPAPRFPTVYDFFDDYLTVAYEVQSHGEYSRWCAQWWRHSGVLFRVTAMWRGYEKLRHLDPLGADEQFLRTIGDYHMRTLLGEKSPMQSCSNSHTPSRTLRTTPMEDSNA